MKYWLNLGFLEIDQLLPIAAAADRRGFEGVALSDHLVFPSHIESRYPYASGGNVNWPVDAPWPDAWVAIAAMAQVSDRLRFTTAVHVAPLRDVFALAKAIGTASGFAPGRVACGFGSGWMREEFAIVGQEFERRGRRLDEMIAVMKLLWSGEPVTFDGDEFTFGEVRMRPPAGQLPVLVGGNSEPAMRRAAKHDGWIGAFPGLVEARALLARLSVLRRGATESSPFETLMTATPRAVRHAEELDELGLDGLIIPAVALSSEPTTGSIIAALDRFADQNLPTSPATVEASPRGSIST